MKNIKIKGFNMKNIKIKEINRAIRKEDKSAEYSESHALVIDLDVNGEDVRLSCSVYNLEETAKFLEKLKNISIKNTENYYREKLDNLSLTSVIKLQQSPSEYLNIKRNLKLNLEKVQMRHDSGKMSYHLENGGQGMSYQDFFYQKKDDEINIKDFSFFIESPTQAVKYLEDEKIKILFEISDDIYKKSAITLGSKEPDQNTTMFERDITLSIIDEDGNQLGCLNDNGVIKVLGAKDGQKIQGCDGEGVNLTVSNKDLITEGFVRKEKGLHTYINNDGTPQRETLTGTVLQHFDETGNKTFQKENYVIARNEGVVGVVDNKEVYNEWIVDGDVWLKNYGVEATNEFKPYKKQATIKTLEIDDNVLEILGSKDGQTAKIYVDWGSNEMEVYKGGVITDQGYGIAPKEFKDTYEKVNSFNPEKIAKELSHKVETANKTSIKPKKQ